MKQKKSFMLYLDYWNSFKLMTDEELGKLLRFLYIYEREGKTPQTNNEKLLFAFAMIKENLDRDRQKYKEVCQRNKETAIKRWEKMRNNGIEIPAEELMKYED